MEAQASLWVALGYREERLYGRMDIPILHVLRDTSVPKPKKDVNKVQKMTKGRYKEETARPKVTSSVYDLTTSDLENFPGGSKNEKNDIYTV